MTRRFSVAYAPEQAADPLLGPDEIVRTAAEGHGVVLFVDRNDERTADFEVEAGTDAEVDHLLIRLRRHHLDVTEGSQP